MSSISSIESSTNISNTSNSTYTYNSDGSITVMSTRIYTSPGNTQTTNGKTINYFSQGNLVRAEYYSITNGINTLIETVTFTYDTNNSPYKNIKGFNVLTNENVNNLKSETHKNASNVTTRTVQITYQYNSQNFPTSYTGVITNYTINSQTGASTPQTPISQNGTITYY